jgi:hypothetical protein
MKRTAWIPMVLVLACGDTKGASEGGQGPTSDPSTGGAEETGGPTVGETGAPPARTTGIQEPESSGGSEGGSSGCTFLDCDGDIPKSGECDQWAQDCPEGQKCSAYADDGSNAWNNTKCVEVANNPGQPGDACSVEGNGVSGVDSCAEGAMCWDVGAENTGVCVALCEGTPEAPQCESGFSCAIANTVLNLCLADCDPLTQDCPGDDLCVGNGDHFICVLDASGEEGQAFDPCEYGNACDPGLLCLDPTAATECDPAAGGCCSPFCDTSAPSCPGVGQTCQPYFEMGTAPPGYELVGVCSLPA